MHNKCYSNLLDKDAIGWGHPCLLVEITLLGNVSNRIRVVLLFD